MKLDWRAAVGAGVVVLLVALVGVGGGLLLYNRYGPTTPREEALAQSVEQSRQNGENLCDFVAAIAHDLSPVTQFLAVAQPDVVLVAEVNLRTISMVIIADSCRVRP